MVSQDGVARAAFSLRHPRAVMLREGGGSCDCIRSSTAATVCRDQKD